MLMIQDIDNSKSQRRTTICDRGDKIEEMYVALHFPDSANHLKPLLLWMIVLK